MDLGLWKPDDKTDKARQTLICVCRVSSCIFTERLLKIKIKKNIGTEMVSKFLLGFGQGDSLKANKNDNSPRVKNCFYGTWIFFLNPRSRILKEFVTPPVKPNRVLPQISAESGLDSSYSPKIKEILLKTNKQNQNPRKHATIEQTDIS